MATVSYILAPREVTRIQSHTCPPDFKFKIAIKSVLSCKLSRLVDTPGRVRQGRIYTDKALADLWRASRCTSGTRIAAEDGIDLCSASSGVQVQRHKALVHSPIPRSAPGTKRIVTGRVHCNALSGYFLPSCLSRPESAHNLIPASMSR